MTAKEALRKLIDDLPDERAEYWLEQVERDPSMAIARPQNGSGRTLLELTDDLRAFFKDVPGEDWDKLPPAKDLDGYLNADLDEFVSRRAERK